MIAASHNRSHSASVQLTLQFAEAQLDVAQAAPDRIILRNAVDLPPGDAILTINIDGQITKHHIRLPDGASCDSPIVATTR